MLVVRVELWSAVTGEKTEIARSVIFNDGTGSPTKGNYVCATLRGRDKQKLDKAMMAYLKNQKRDPLEPLGAARVGAVSDYPRLRLSVWCLVQQALQSMNYGKKQ